jgi:hypothetical protein
MDGRTAMNGRTALALAVLIAVLVAGCAPKASLEAHWPRADAERTVARPADAVVWPLTGKPALDASAAASPVVVLPVSDEPAGASLPGLDSADVVYEIAVGSTDRILAVFHSALPAAAGPLRQAEGGDASLASAYGASLAKSRQSGLADVASLASAVTSPGAAPPSMAFTAPAVEAIRGGNRAMLVSIPLADGSKVDWRFDTATGGYQRFVDSKPALASGTTLLRSTNVAVLWASSGTVWPPTPLYGRGRASVFMGQRRFLGSWEASGGPPVLRDQQGQPVALAPGNTWFEVVGNATDIVLH